MFDLMLPILQKFITCSSYILIFRMKLALVSIALCLVICAANAMKLLGSSSRQIHRREHKLFRRLVTRQVPNGETSQKISVQKYA